jgi:hypothetical protein
MAHSPSAAEATWDAVALLMGLAFIVIAGAAAWLTSNGRPGQDRADRGIVLVHSFSSGSVTLTSGAESSGLPP